MYEKIPSPTKAATADVPTQRPMMVDAQMALQEGLERLHRVINRLDGMHVRIYGPTPAEVEKEMQPPNCFHGALRQTCDILHAQLLRAENLVDALERFV